MAGTGVCGLAGDGGPATEAQISDAAAIAIDAQGDLYVADHHNNRIRRVDGRGVITTVAGTEDLDQPFGLTVDGQTLFLTDTFHGLIKTVPIQ